MTARITHDSCVATTPDMMLDEPFEAKGGASVHRAPPPVAVSSCASDESSPSAAASDAATTTAFDANAIERGFDCIERKYRVEPRVLGTGHQGSVRRGFDRSGRAFAVKTIRRDAPGVNPGGLAREIALLRRVEHEGIVKLVDVYEDDECVHLVTDLCAGGELFDKILEKSSEDNGMPCFAEDEAAEILRQVLASLRYLHVRGIAHRDVKPENILFENNEEGSPIKLIDFGLARKHVKSAREPHMRKIVGTPYYIAPEVLRRKYDKQCDLWSVGVVAYIMLCGYPPFEGASDDQTHRSVLRGKYDLPSREWDGVSAEAKDFVRRLLEMDPRMRMTADEALGHPWIARRGAELDAAAVADEDQEVAHPIFAQVPAFAGMLRGARRRGSMCR